MTLEELKEKYRQGQINWKQYLAGKFLIDGDTTIFKDLTKEGMYAIEALGNEFGDGKISYEEHMQKVDDVFSKIQQFLVKEGVASGIMPKSEYQDLLDKWETVLKTYPVKTAQEKYDKLFVSSILVLECWDRYLDKYVPSAPKKMRFLDIYFEPAAEAAAKTSTYMGDV